MLSRGDKAGELRPTLRVQEGYGQPRLLPAPPFDELKFDRPAMQTAALLAASRETAARKARRSAGRHGRERGRDSDLQTVWEEQARLHDGKGPVEWHKPAASLGLTQARVVATSGRSPALVSLAFRFGLPNNKPIGRRDPWDVWFTTRTEADHLFRADANGRTGAMNRGAQATAPVWMTRTAQRLARRRIRTEGGVGA